MPSTLFTIDYLCLIVYIMYFSWPITYLLFLQKEKFDQRIRHESNRDSHDTGFYHRASTYRFKNPWKNHTFSWNAPYYTAGINYSKRNGYLQMDWRYVEAILFKNFVFKKVNMVFLPTSFSFFVEANNAPLKKWGNKNEREEKKLIFIPF